MQQLNCNWLQYFQQKKHHLLNYFLFRYNNENIKKEIVIVIVIVIIIFLIKECFFKSDKLRESPVEATAPLELELEDHDGNLYEVD